jgi:hypothetical protein
VGAAGAEKITCKSYDEIGGVEGALTQRAERVFAELTKDGTDPAMAKAFQRLFTRLAALGEGQEDTRPAVERENWETRSGHWPFSGWAKNRLVMIDASSAPRLL